MEKFNTEKPVDNQLEENETFLEKMRAFKQSPYSIKSALALITVLSALGQEVSASEMGSEEIQAAADKFEQVYEGFSKQNAESDWSGELTFVDRSDIEDYEPKMIEDFPDFPKTGSGVFEMRSASSIVFKDTEGYFAGITQQFSVDTNEESQIVPEGGSFEVQVDYVEGVDVDKQIINSVAEKIGYIYGKDIQAEGVSILQSDSEDISYYSNTETNSQIELPIANWTIIDVKNEDGQVTGYTVTIQPGKSVPVEVQ